MNVYIRLFAILNFVNGVFMLIAPESWYQTVPGVTDTGPYNPHFVRDIGIAFVASSVGIWMAVGSSWQSRLSGAVVGMLFLAGHALFHVMEMFMHSPNAAAVIRDLAMIVVPAAIAAVWMIRELRRERVPDPTDSLSSNGANK
jgi:putative effector of murein hydrolase LrgA (UPF0299 family)